MIDLSFATPKTYIKNIMRINWSDIILNDQYNTP